MDTTLDLGGYDEAVGRCRNERSSESRVAMESTNFLTWSQVVLTHGSQSGIATRNGQVRSLLCNQAKEGYADEVFEDKIFYRVTNSTNPKSVAALRAAVGSRQPLHVFEKLGVNRWLDHGEWNATKMAEEGDGTVFLLLRP
jgi:hypothetical protein